MMEPYHLGKRILTITILSLAVMLFLVSCNGNKQIDISPSNSIALSPGIKWALVHEPFAAFRKEPSFESPVVANARRGEIMQVLGDRYVTQESGRSTHTVVWYSFELGWLDESLVTIYDNKFKAEGVAATYTE